jgi:hypothetical protein
VAQRIRTFDDLPGAKRELKWFVAIQGTVELITVRQLALGCGNVQSIKHRGLI